MGRPGPLTTDWPAGNEVVLRPATSADRALLIEWRNDQDVVRYSLSGRPVAAAEHANWLTARLAEPAPRLWIAEEAGEPVGQVRIDLEDETGTVSISVAPARRGRGVGSRMLRALVIEMRRTPRFGASWPWCTGRTGPTPVLRAGGVQRYRTSAAWVRRPGAIGRGETVTSP